MQKTVDQTGIKMEKESESKRKPEPHRHIRFTCSRKSDIIISDAVI